MTSVKLSDRLRAVADMVTPGLVLADIGTDHAYIPIYLTEQKRIPRAIAMDVNKGPLLRANTHIQEHALSGRIETRLSDGLTALRPGEAQSIVIAGMGGALTIRILKNAEASLNRGMASEWNPDSHTSIFNLDGSVSVKDSDDSASAMNSSDSASVVDSGNPVSAMDSGNSVSAMDSGNPVSAMDSGNLAAVKDSSHLGRTWDDLELMLQPQSEVSEVREYLMRSGWRIVREDMVFEEGKYYPMMKAKRLPPMDVHEREHSGESGRDHSRAPGREYSGKHSAGYSQAELAFGPELLRMRHPVLCQYLRKERKTQERILESLEKGQGEKAAARVREIQNQICLIDEALNRYFSD